LRYTRLKRGRSIGRRGDHAGFSWSDAAQGRRITGGLHSVSARCGIEIGVSARLHFFSHIVCFYFQGATMRWDWLSSLRGVQRHQVSASTRQNSIARRRVSRLSVVELLEHRTLLTRLGTWEVTLDADGDHGWNEQGDEFHILRSLPDAGQPVAGDVYGDGPQPLTFQETFTLHSRPTAAHTIYLDFNGHVTSGTGWQNGATFTTPEYDRDGNPASFSQSELDDILEIWERVVEDFAPFDVNVTTEEPPIEDLMRTGPGDTAWGIRVAIGGHFNDWLGSSAGGIAFIGSFNSPIDTPTYVFSEVLFNPKNVAEATSHEIGHTLGLGHDGDSVNSYYSGHGSGSTGWAPIMGVGYSQPLVQWSRGEYSGANNQQDDLLTITSQNGFDYRPDLAGDMPASAAELTLNGIAVNQPGLIETTADVDVFRFTTGDGPVSFDIQPWHRSPNLDIGARLLTADGDVIATSNPIGRLDAQISAMLDEGEYFLAIEGVGEGDPLGTGYSDYGSIGQFTITGTITEPSEIDIEVIAGDLVLTDRFDRDANLIVRVESETVVITSETITLDALTGVTQISPTQVSIPLTSITGEVLMDLRGGDDNILVEMPDGFVDLAFDFQAGQGIDSFTMSGTGIVAPISSATYTRAGIRSGEIAYVAGVLSPAVTYSGLERLVDQTTASSRDVLVTGPIADVLVNAGVSAGDGLVSLSTVSGTTLVVASPVDALTIDTTLSGVASAVVVGALAGELTSGLSVTGDANDSIVVSAAYDPRSNPVRLVSGSVQIDAALGRASTLANLELAANTVSVNATIESRGILQIRPLSDAASIGIGNGSAGTLQLDDAEIQNLGSRFEQIQIGDPVGAEGGVEITSGVFRAPLQISGSSIAVTGLDAGSESVELSALTGAITSLADTVNPVIVPDISGGMVTLRTSGVVAAGIGTQNAPVYVSATALVTDSTASGDDQFLATLDQSGTVLSAAGGGVFHIESGKFDAGASNVFANAEGLTFGNAGSGIFDLAGNSVSVAFVSGAGSDGRIDLGGGSLTIDGSQTVTFNGRIIGTGDLIRSGSGIQVLGGENTYVGTTLINGGGLQIDGSLAGDVSLSGGVLSGSGSIAGDVSGSASDGGVAPGSSPGQLTVSGSVSLGSSQTFVVEIEGLAAGSEHDQLVLDGAASVLTLNDTVLSASISGYVPTAGDEITIIDLVDSTSFVVGSFADLPEGTAVEIDGFAFTISYVGGTDGNDVVLTAVPTHRTLF
jgi:autotransporter-associated beta strand protein